MSDKHHKLNYIELPATDLAAMKTFYSAAFGWRFKDWGDVYVEILDGGIDGGFDGTGERPSVGEGGALVILYSDDIDASEAAVTAAGGKISKPIFQFPGGRRFHFIDPCGNELAVWTEIGGGAT